MDRHRPDHQSPAHGPVDDEELVAAVDEARARHAAARRAAEGWLRRQAAEDATFHGVLADLAASRTPVTVTLVDGRTRRGTVTGAGPDVAVLSVGDATVLVAGWAVARVRTPASAAEPAGDGATPAGPSLRGLLTELAAERVRVGLAAGPGAPLVGTLTAVGSDVVSVVPDTDTTAVVVVPLGAVAEVTVDP